MQRIYINCFFSFLLLTISFVAQGQDEDFALNFIDNSSVKELAYPACASHNVDLRACRPSICQQQTKLGRVYRKVVKKDDKDNCLYQERIENYGNMECTFKQEDLEIAQAVMDYHLSFQLLATVPCSLLLSLTKKAGRKIVISASRSNR
jgi:hypothetical protein